MLKAYDIFEVIEFDVASYHEIQLYNFVCQFKVIFNKKRRENEKNEPLDMPLMYAVRTPIHFQRNFTIFGEVINIKMLKRPTQQTTADSDAKQNILLQWANILSIMYIGSFSFSIFISITLFFARIHFHYFRITWSHRITINAFYVANIYDFFYKLKDCRYFNQSLYIRATFFSALHHLHVDGEKKMLKCIDNMRI